MTPAGRAMGGLRHDGAVLWNCARYNILDYAASAHAVMAAKSCHSCKFGLSEKADSRWTQP